MASFPNAPMPNFGSNPEANKPNNQETSKEVSKSSRGSEVLQLPSPEDLGNIEPKEHSPDTPDTPEKISNSFLENACRTGKMMVLPASAMAATMVVPAGAAVVLMGGIAVYAKKDAVINGWKGQGVWGIGKALAGATTAMAVRSMPGSAALGAATGAAIGAVRVVGPEAYRQWKEERENKPLKKIRREIEKDVKKAGNDTEALQEILNDNRKKREEAEVGSRERQMYENAEKYVLLALMNNREDLSPEDQVDYLRRLDAESGMVSKGVEAIESGDSGKIWEAGGLEEENKRLSRKIWENVDKNKLMWAVGIGAAMGGVGGFGQSYAEEANFDVTNNAHTAEEMEAESDGVEKEEAEELSETSAPSVNDTEGDGFSRAYSGQRAVEMDDSGNVHAAGISGGESGEPSEVEPEPKDETTEKKTGEEPVIGYYEDSYIDADEELSELGITREEPDEQVEVDTEPGDGPTEERTAEEEPDVSDSTTEIPAGGGPQAAEASRLAEEYYTSAEEGSDVSGSSTETPAGGETQATETTEETSKADGEEKDTEEPSGRPVSSVNDFEGDGFSRAYSGQWGEEVEEGSSASEETEVDTEAEAEPAMEIPASFEIQQGSNLWDSVAEELKGENGEEPTQEQILFATAKIAEEQGIAVPEWGIEGDMDQTEVPAGYQVEPGEETREAINKAMEGDLPPYEEWPGTTGTASPGTGEAAEAELSSDQGSESPMQSFNQSVEETAAELGGEEGEVAGSEPQETPSSQEGGPGYETGGVEGGTESSVDETQEQLLINNSNNVASHLEREIGDSDAITDDMKSNFATQYQNEFGRIEGTESNSLLQVTDGLIIKNDLEDYYDFVRERSGDSFPTETREEFVEKLREPLQALRGEGEMSAEEAEEILTNRILEDIHHTQASILNPTEEASGYEMAGEEEPGTPAGETSQEGASEQLSGEEEQVVNNLESKIEGSDQVTAEMKHNFVSQYQDMFGSFSGLEGDSLGQVVSPLIEQYEFPEDYYNFVEQRTPDSYPVEGKEQFIEEMSRSLEILRNGDNMPQEEVVAARDQLENRIFNDISNIQEGEAVSGVSEEYSGPIPRSTEEATGAEGAATEASQEASGSQLRETLPDAFSDNNIEDWSFLENSDTLEQMDKVKLNELLELERESMVEALDNGNSNEVLERLGIDPTTMGETEVQELNMFMVEIKDTLEFKKSPPGIDAATFERPEGPNTTVLDYLKSVQSKWGGGW